jgi:hypothetical protein
MKWADLKEGQRAKLRRKGFNITKRTGNGFARIPSGAKLAPPSFETLVAIHQELPDGRIRKFVVSRDRVDPAILAKRRNDVVQPLA